MEKIRVVSLIDGFNLYHAIKRLHKPYLKWVDLRVLSQVLLKNNSEELQSVLYFSARAIHFNQLVRERQQAYIKALELSGVTPILGQFKKKDRFCPNCKHKWTGHEEKETDVNIALYLLDLANQNAFDRALVISNDSDLVPAIQLVRKRFPEKIITTVCPPNTRHSNELIQVSSNKTKIRSKHLEQCLLPDIVYGEDEIDMVVRPIEYESDFSLTY